MVVSAGRLIGRPSRPGRLLWHELSYSARAVGTDVVMQFRHQNPDDWREAPYAEFDEITIPGLGPFDASLSGQSVYSGPDGQGQIVTQYTVTLPPVAEWLSLTSIKQAIPLPMGFAYVFVDFGSNETWARGIASKMEKKGMLARAPRSYTVSLSPESYVHARTRKLDIYDTSDPSSSHKVPISTQTLPYQESQTIYDITPV